MKTKSRHLLLKLWHRLFRRPAAAHDPFLSLSITTFNSSTGWDRLLQKQLRSLA
ncbi:MAG TPA: hypothetical protein VEX43_00645 [Chthoniobacterales bacterium]|nr:hypothetical protein [Chthoniobacterales bacterium]